MADHSTNQGSSPTGNANACMYLQSGRAHYCHRTARIWPHLIPHPTQRPLFPVIGKTSVALRAWIYLLEVAIVRVKGETRSGHACPAIYCGLWISGLLHRTQCKPKVGLAVFCPVRTLRHLMCEDHEIIGKHRLNILDALGLSWSRP